MNERVLRFIEEALELVQAEGLTQEEVTKMVERVYSREKGDPKQEVGGVCITLMAYCANKMYDLDHLEEVELNRIWANKDKIRQKHNQKAAEGFGMRSNHA